MYQMKFALGASGNISARLDAERILLTPSGLSKGFLRPQDLIIVNMAGEKVAGQEHLKPTSEFLMHLEAYKQRPDVGGVIHAHPIHATALTIAGVSFQQYIIPEALLLLGEIAVTPYATPASPENRDVISQLVLQHNVMMLAYHGSLTVGEDVWTAYMRLEMLEHTSQMIYLVHELGGSQPLPPHQVEKLRGGAVGYHFLPPALED
jgi:L-fuculose-phosphate aldolase